MVLLVTGVAGRLRGGVARRGLNASAAIAKRHGREKEAGHLVSRVLANNGVTSRTAISQQGRATKSSSEGNWVQDERAMPKSEAIVSEGNRQAAICKQTV